MSMRKRIDEAAQISIAKRKAKHYQAKTKPTVRNCLKCEQNFMSTWIGNRLCDYCKKRPDTVNPRRSDESA